MLNIREHSPSLAKVLVLEVVLVVGGGVGLIRTALLLLPQDSSLTVSWNAWLVVFLVKLSRG